MKCEFIVLSRSQVPACRARNTLKRIYSGKAYRGLGFVYIKKGDLKKSKEMYIAALQIDPEDEMSMNELYWIEASKKGLLKCPKCQTAVRIHQKSCQNCKYELSGAILTG